MADDINFYSIYKTENTKPYLLLLHYKFILKFIFETISNGAILKRFIRE
jgi:hypothetical protein